MSHPMIVYTQQASTISIEDILAQMRARGVPVEWHYRLLSERGHPDNWTAGYFLPEGRSQPQVTLAKEVVQAYLREEVLQAYADVLTESQRQALLTAQTRYQLASYQTPDAERERMLVHVVHILADLGDGLILDIDAEQFYDRHSYPARHARLLGT